MLNWEGREPYEKAIIAGIGAALAVLTLWVLVLRPVLSAKSEAADDLARATRDLAVVQRGVQALGPSSTTGTQAFDRAVLFSTARAAGLTPSRVQPDGEALRVWFDDVPSAAFYQTLDGLRSGYAVTLTRLQVSQAESGVDAQLTLSPSS